MPSRAKVARQVPVSCISPLAVRLCMEYVAFVAIRFTFRFMCKSLPTRCGYIQIIAHGVKICQLRKWKKTLPSLLALVVML